MKRFGLFLAALALVAVVLGGSAFAMSRKSPEKATPAKPQAAKQDAGRDAGLPKDKPAPPQKPLAEQKKPASGEHAMKGEQRKAPSAACRCPFCMKHAAVRQGGGSPRWQPQARGFSGTSAARRGRDAKFLRPGTGSKRGKAERTAPQGAAPMMRGRRGVGPDMWARPRGLQSQRNPMMRRGMSQPWNRSPQMRPEAFQRGRVNPWGGWPMNRPHMWRQPRMQQGRMMQWNARQWGPSPWMRQPMRGWGQMGRQPWSQGPMMRQGARSGRGGWQFERPAGRSQMGWQARPRRAPMMQQGRQSRRPAAGAMRRRAMPQGPQAWEQGKQVRPGDAALKRAPRAKEKPEKKEPGAQSERPKDEVSAKPE